VGQTLIQLVEGAAASPWFYLAIFGFAAVDAFLPAVPSESLVITAGVFAATGEPNLALVVVAAALGAFAGDHVSFFGGRTVGTRALERVPAGTRRGAAIGWAREALAMRGGMILVVCRYVPGARTAVTLTAGSVRYPLRSFSFFDSIAAGSWALYSALVGFLGGAAFEDDPLKGLLLGLGLAAAVAALVELGRHLRGRTRAAAARGREPVRLPACADPASELLDAPRAA
jgi:membrane protein DedA with SNARE-associated domain